MNAQGRSQYSRRDGRWGCTGTRLRWLLLIAIITCRLSGRAVGGEIELQVSAGEDDGCTWGYHIQNQTATLVLFGYTGQIPYDRAGFRFTSVPIAQGATITSACLKVHSWLAQSDPVSARIQAENTNSALSFMYIPYISDRPMTTTSVLWNITESWNQDAWYTSPDIKSVIQQVVDRPDWSYGNDMAVYLSAASASGTNRAINTYEASTNWPGLSFPAKLVIGATGADSQLEENYIPGATNTPSSVPTYKNSPTMYYDNPGGICWATATADILGYWDRNPYSGIVYWNLIDHGRAPLLQNSLPTEPGHEEADVKSAVAWLAYEYYTDPDNPGEDEIIEDFCNDVTNALNFNASYLPPVSSYTGKSNYYEVVENEIDAGRPTSAGSWGTYFGGAHQVPVIGYKRMENMVNSTVYIHRNTGGTQSEYVNFFASDWEDLDMDKIVPGGSPDDHYDPMGDDGKTTSVTIDPTDVYNFRQTHNFDTGGDNDWVRFTATSNKAYTIESRKLGSSCDTLLYLYSGTGDAMLSFDNDMGREPGASRTTWICRKDGTYLIRARDVSASAAGDKANYDLEILEEDDIGAKGTPGWWLDMYGLTNGFTFEEDYDDDGDGVVAWKEWAARTSPTNKTSVLCFETMGDVGTSGRLPLEFSSISNCVYTLETSTNLLDSDGWEPASFAWTTSGGWQNGAFTATLSRTTVYVDPSSTNRAFRVTVPSR